MSFDDPVAAREARQAGRANAAQERAHPQASTRDMLRRKFLCFAGKRRNKWGCPLILWKA